MPKASENKHIIVASLSYMAGTAGVVGVTIWLFFHRHYWVGAINLVSLNLLYKNARETLNEVYNQRAFLRSLKPGTHP